ncbi:hypothetical protein GCM10010339_16820 [Streptomyces alanosinicus]|uniref:Uncharacterized protein n=1 Tax=Streptomyces alanosinicus TaxID=68171 RepID=A0A918YE75_9ACTN|nr:hypothetical protein GCM10010339_16820 [Streptomyces alanosinicus]
MLDAAEGLEGPASLALDGDQFVPERVRDPLGQGSPLDAEAEFEPPPAVEAGPYRVGVHPPEPPPGHRRRKTVGPAP